MELRLDPVSNFSECKILKEKPVSRICIKQQTRVRHSKCSNEQLEKQINLYDATAEEQSHFIKKFFLSLESK